MACRQCFSYWTVLPITVAHWWPTEIFEVRAFIEGRINCVWSIHKFVSMTHAGTFSHVNNQSYQGIIVAWCAYLDNDIIMCTQSLPFRSMTLRLVSTTANLQSVKSMLLSCTPLHSMFHLLGFEPKCSLVLCSDLYVLYTWTELWRLCFRRRLEVLHVPKVDPLTN